MGRKVFLSFLGTNPYIPCNYDGVENCEFVQEALIKKHCLSWDENDKIIIFLTKDAEIKNWKDEGNFEKGLERKLNSLNIKPEIIPVFNVFEGKSEKEIWQIFDIVFEKIIENDELYYDVTHSFRSLPMLGMTLLNYAKFLKNIKVSAIYYGALEALGSIPEVKQMPIEQRNVPVFDLTSFSALQDWSVAADNFINYGNSEKIKNLIKENIEPILKETKGKDAFAQNLKKFSESIETVTKVFSTCRGNHIKDGTVFETLKSRILAIKSESINALLPLLEKIEEKVNDYEKNDVLNGFKAVKWCIDHNLIQQGITMLQETIITYVLTELRENTNVAEKREVVSSAFYLKSFNFPEEKWNKNCQDNKALVKKVFKFDEIGKIYDSLRDFRNNINHGGFCDDWNSDQFSKKLKSSYEELMKIINNHA